MVIYRKRQHITMSQFLVLIADIESSKDIEEKQREELQDKLQGELDNLNKGHTEPISPYTITLGDEFQAVFKHTDMLFTGVLGILALLHPVRIRFSLGIGGINTEVNKKQAIGMDGPAFHCARRGMDQLKKSGFLFNLATEGEQSPVLGVINNSLQLLSHEISSWHKNRIAILHLVREGHDYKEIARRLAISQTAFYKNKEAGALEVINELLDNIS